MSFRMKQTLRQGPGGTYHQHIQVEFTSPQTNAVQSLPSSGYGNNHSSNRGSSSASRTSGSSYSSSHSGGSNRGCLEWSPQSSSGSSSGSRSLAVSERSQWTAEYGH